ncbi:MAG: flagellar basal body-associated FliL family protein [Burkholderiales bacterium]|nr:flagellar basal body-associated FliL family protein [Burkholderiales bacterium]
MSDKAESKAAAPAKSGKGRLFIMVGAMLVLLLGTGGGAWWFTRGDAGGETVKAVPALPPVFVALDPFTVNLQPENSGNQYMQVGITVKVRGQAVANRLKELMPEIRNRMLLILSAKKASELLVPEGKTVLARELAAEIAALLDPEAKARQAETIAERTAVTVAAAPAETGSDAAEQPPETGAGSAAAEGETAPPPAPAADNAATGPVLSVLFTSLIIQ